MQSGKVVDLRKRKTGAATRPLVFRGPSSRRVSLQARRRKLKVLAGFAALVLAASAVYGIGYASYLPEFSVQRIDIGGTETIRPTLVRLLAETVIFNGTHPLISRSLVFAFPRSELETAMKEYFPRVKDVSISRESLFAQTVRIAIVERSAYAQWCATADQCFLMDREGMIFAAATAGSRRVTPYVFSGGLASSTPIGETYLPGHLTSLFALLERLGQAGFAAETIVVEGQEFTVLLTRGYSVRASFGADVSSVVHNLELVLSAPALRGKESALKYIDLRFGNRVYYK